MGDTLKTGEVNFDVSYSPDPLNVKTSVSIDDTTVKVTINDVPKLNVTLKPTFSWNPVNDILTCVTSIANLFSSQISDQVVDQVKGISIDLYTIPNIHVELPGVSLTITPSNLKLENDNGYLMVSGDLDVTGL